MNNEIDPEIVKLIEEYQCPGFTIGNSISCYKKYETDSCDVHFPGTVILKIGKIFLGLPKGFNRKGD